MREPTCEQPPRPQFWLPHHDREPHFREPTIDELTALWISHNPTSMLDLGEGTYGTAEVPTALPTAFLSVDLCEVVRETAGSLFATRGGTIEDMVVDAETGYMDYSKELNGWGEDHQWYKQTLLQEYMHHDHVKPVPHSGTISDLLRAWRQKGVYIVANTSTLAGCEASTIRFLHEQFPNCFQGILLPRNHDGKGSTTKAMIFDELIRSVQRELNTSDETNEIPRIAIDDALHHSVDLHEGGSMVFVPAYPWNEALEHHPDIQRVPQLFGTVDTFAAMDIHLRNIVQ